MDLNFKMLLVCLLGYFLAATASQENGQTPLLQEISLPRKLAENQAVRLNCDLLKGSRPIQFRWFFDDGQIREDDRSLQTTHRDDMSSLTIKSLSVESVGRYKCVATNEHGSDQQTVAVYVNSERTFWVLFQSEVR